MAIGSILGGILGKAIEPIMDVIDKAVVDKDKKAQMKVDLQRAVLEAEDKAEQRIHEQMIAQNDTNKIEATHRSVFIAGWRPFIGWAGGGALAYNYIAYPLIGFVARLSGYDGEFPVLDVDALWPLLAAMLGVGSMRSFDKWAGTSNDVLRGVQTPMTKTETTTETLSVGRGAPVVPPGFGTPPEDTPWNK